MSLRFSRKTRKKMATLKIVVICSGQWPPYIKHIANIFTIFSAKNGRRHARIVGLLKPADRGVLRS